MWPTDLYFNLAVQVAWLLFCLFVVRPAMNRWYARRFRDGS